MSRVRMIGPRERLQETLGVLQDFGRVQLDRIPSNGSLRAASPDQRTERERRALRRMFDDADAAIDLLSVPAGTEQAVAVTRGPLADWARIARRVRRQAEALRAREQALADERAVLGRYRGFFDAFRVLLAELANAQHLRAYGVMLPAAERGRVDKLADALREELQVEVVVTSRTLASGDIAVLIAVPVEARERMERAFGAARIAEVPLPSGYADQSLTEAAPAILARLDDIPRQVAEILQERAALASRWGSELRTIRASASDRLSAAAATDLTVATQHAFVIEGWLPRDDMPRLRSLVEQRLGDLVVEELAREEWSGAEAPVVLSNPRLFKPFETLTALMPLPAYGSMDPTPFVAVGFPMLFGMILGDVGYGIVLGAIGGLILWRAKGRMHSIGTIALSCALFAVIFGFLFGEFFGTLGRELFGMRPILLDRENAIVAAIVAAVGIGLVHTMLGLFLSLLTSRGKPRVAISRAVQLAMMIVIVLALLSAVEVLPRRLFGPLGMAALIGFPVLLILEGIIAPIEFFSTLSSVLSYVRIMALGTASVLLASVANDMVGVFGSVLVGVMFALLFHLVNFAMGVFSPTIHALRLHYVEFFKQFYSPGGRPYEPFRHREPRRATTRGIT